MIQTYWEEKVSSEMIKLLFPHKTQEAFDFVNGFIVSEKILVTECFENGMNPEAAAKFILK